MRAGKHCPLQPLPDHKQKLHLPRMQLRRAIKNSFEGKKNMPGKIFVIYKVSSKEPDDTKKLAEQLKSLKNATVKDVKTEAIGFGIEVIKVGVLVDEKNPDAVEKTLEEIRKNPLVQDAQTDAMTLL